MSSVQPLGGVEPQIQQFAQQFTSSMTFLLSIVDTTVIDLMRIVYISLLIVGILLYYSHVAQRLGKDLIKGGITLAIISEFVVPWLVKL
ncbi:MAG: hypothetical protein JRN56_00045 [Nitrososphaerota archaeon]|jgi:hypothetical protein|nr:hypothetical protein [Nitrososphaerota archaeon]MDG6903349.1 hypothetical protein [Nitrososphaerota archaeon]MDG6911789.1 hypothetical protein [Nitrososphaerota archaeon]MDG6940729.1 hypothetical protein [Nitrososphaerota archaeon]MDG6945666.1 hypothetical protein [Nitrososphaerota archaeon]